MRTWCAVKLCMRVLRSAPEDEDDEEEAAGEAGKAGEEEVVAAVSLSGVASST